MSDYNITNTPTSNSFTHEEYAINGHSSVDKELSSSFKGLFEDVDDSDLDIYTNESILDYSIRLHKHADIDNLSPIDYFHIRNCPSSILTLGFDIILNGTTYNRFCFSRDNNSIILLSVDESVIVDEIGTDIFDCKAIALGIALGNDTQRYVRYDYLNYTTEYVTFYTGTQTGLDGEDETSDTPIVATYAGTTDDDEEYRIFDIRKPALLNETNTNSVSSTSIFVYMPYQIVLYQKGRIEFRYSPGCVWLKDDTIVPCNITDAVSAGWTSVTNDTYVNSFVIDSASLTTLCYDMYVFSRQSYLQNFFVDNTSLETIRKSFLPKQDSYVKLSKDIIDEDFDKISSDDVLALTYFPVELLAFQGDAVTTVTEETKLISSFDYNLYGTYNLYSADLSSSEILTSKRQVPNRDFRWNPFFGIDSINDGGKYQVGCAKPTKLSDVE